VRVIFRREWLFGQLDITKNIIFFLSFLYFFTTSADLLSIKVSIFRCKLNHALAFAIFAMLFISKKPWKLDKKIFFSFLITTGLMAISAVYSPMLKRAIGYVLLYLFTFCIYFILPYNLVLAYGREQVFKIYKASFIATGVFGALQFFASFGGILLPFVGQTIGGTIARGQAMTYEPSYFALYMIAYVMYYNACYLFFFETVMEKKKIMHLFLVNIMLIVSTSTGAFFAYFVMVGVFFLLQSSRWVRSCKRKMVKKLALFSLSFAALFAVIAVVAKDIFLNTFWKFFRQGFMAHGSFVERWQGIVNAWNVFIEHPWFGVGVGGVGPFLFQKENSTNVSEVTKEMLIPYDPTNVLTELLASMGVVGTLAFAVFFFLYFKRFYSVTRIKELTMEEKGTIYALLVSLLVMLIVLQFNQNLFRSYVWVHMAFCLGYSVSLREEYDRS